MKAGNRVSRATWAAVICFAVIGSAVAVRRIVKLAHVVMSGHVFVICGVVIGVSALVMSFGMPAIGGVNQTAATTLFATFFLFALGKAFWHIRRREVALHREWMIRAFAVGLAVATIRPIIGMFFATGRISGLTPNEFFGTAIWIGFTVHLIAAEVWILATEMDREHWAGRRIALPG